MNELFEKQGNSIFTFKPGDIIIRLKPVIKSQSVLNDNLGITIQVQTGIENSFRRPIQFVGIENNQIYLRVIKPGYAGKRHVHKVHLEEYSEDWALFVVPDGLTIEDCC